MYKSVPMLNKGHKASLSIAGGLLFACFTMTAWAAEDLSDLSTKERLTRLERLWENQGMADMVLRLESMQQELQRLQGEIEVQGRDIEILKDSLREMEQRSATAPPPVQNPALGPPGVADSDIPLSAVMDGEAGAAESMDGIDDSIPEPTANQAPQPNNVEPGAGAANGPAEAGSPEQLAYQQAFDFLKKSQYDSAVAGFNDYLTRYPQGNNAGNAQYWLGETHYVKRKFSDAQQAFETLLTRYPNTPKRADATLKIGFVHYELGQWSEARNVLDEVKANYPGTSAAKLAETRLQKMSTEGH